MMDSIERTILEQGHIDIAELNRPWIPAQVLRHGKDFDKYFLRTKPYSYQWNVLLSELRRAAKEKPSEKHARFFERSLVKPMIRHYLHTIKKPLSESVFALTESLMKDTEWVSLLATLTAFMRTAPMPAHMEKCPQWVSAFKGNGAYNTMLPMIKYHNCCLYERGRALNTYESLELLDYLAATKDFGTLYDIMLEFLSYNYASDRLAVTNEVKR